jgi:nicotinamide-nucleotide amidase
MPCLRSPSQRACSESNVNDPLYKLVESVGAALAGRKLMLAIAESCTGGGVAEAVTRVAGSSQWFDRGFVTYSNLAKQEMLGVPSEILERCGAVSEETVNAMARGVLARSRADVAIAVSGIAGPTGGTEEKPVGTVCFAWCVGQGPPVALTEHLKGDRESIRRQSVELLLRGLLRVLQSLSHSAPPGVPAK